MVFIAFCVSIIPSLKKFKIVLLAQLLVLLALEKWETCIRMCYDPGAKRRFCFCLITGFSMLLFPKDALPAVAPLCNQLGLMSHHIS